MKTAIQDCEDIVIAKLEGELTADACETLRDTISELLAQPRKALVLDLGGIGFIDSMGLELLLWIRDYCRLSVSQFRLVGLNDHCKKILEMTRLLSEFTYASEVVQAIKSLA
jgi:anti-anti-sigma factor